MSMLWILRCLGLSGILGAIFFMAGDLLYNHIPGSDQSPTEKMSLLPESRLLNGGTLGLVGAWFYLLAAGHVYLAFQPIGTTFSLILFIAFATLMVCYGISHTAYFAIAAGAKAAVQLGSDAETGGKLGNALFQRFVYITYGPAVISTLMMGYGIVSGRSHYPFWMVALIPGVIYLLKPLVVRLLKGRVKDLVNDCYDNLSLFIYFVISTIVLWNVPIG